MNRQKTDIGTPHAQQCFRSSPKSAPMADVVRHVAKLIRNLESITCSSTVLPTGSCDADSMRLQVFPAKAQRGTSKRPGISATNSSRAGPPMHTIKSPTLSCSTRRVVVPPPDKKCYDPGFPLDEQTNCAAVSRSPLCILQNRVSMPNGDQDHYGMSAGDIQAQANHLASARRRGGSGWRG